MPAQFLVMLNWVCLSRQSMFQPPLQEPWQTLLWWRWKGNYEADATQPSALCVHRTVSFPGTYLNISIICLHLTYIYTIVLLRGKYRTLNFCELQTLNLRYSLKSSCIIWYPNPCLNTWEFPLSPCSVSCLVYTFEFVRYWGVLLLSMCALSRQCNIR